MMSINPLLARMAPPPIPEAASWVRGRTFPADRPLIDVCQAVPGYPPAPGLIRHLAERLPDPALHRYGPVLGQPELREALAAHLSAEYQQPIGAAEVAITAGCNQAFCLAALAVAGAGDEVILPAPWYFNHRMWLEMQGIGVSPLGFREDAGGVPDPEEAAARITPRTRAIVLVTPNNPTGAIYPPDVIAAFYHVARRHGIALILDETYKDFRDGEGPAHKLFAHPGWRDTLIQLYSFSKAYCLTGHRTGSIVAGPATLATVEKSLDTLAICAPRLGQEAALYGLRELAGWREANRRMMRGRAAAFRGLFDGPPTDGGYRLVSIGAYFAYLRHPFESPSEEVARRLADRHNLLCLPGSMFGPEQDRYLRFAFANVDESLVPVIGERLADSLAPA